MFTRSYSTIRPRQEEIYFSEWDRCGHQSRVVLPSTVSLPLLSPVSTNSSTYQQLSTKYEIRALKMNLRDQIFDSKGFKGRRYVYDSLLRRAPWYLDR
jgi:hypothetical protein